MISGKNLSETLQAKKVHSHEEIIEFVTNFPIFKDQVIMLYEFKSRDIIRHRGPLRLLGFEHELINKFFLDSIVHPDELPTVKAIYRDIANQIHEKPDVLLEKVSLSLSFRIRRSNGIYYRINSQNQFIKPKGDSELYMITIINDLSHLEYNQGVFWKIKGDGLELFNFKKEKDLNCTKSLTKREIDLIKCMADGLDSKNIAVTLNISLHTVNTHRKNMLKKMKFDNSIQLISYAFRNHLI